MEIVGVGGAEEQVCKGAEGHGCRREGVNWREGEWLRRRIGDAMRVNDRIKHDYHLQGVASPPLESCIMNPQSPI